MLGVLRRLSQGGMPPRLGDDDGGRLFDPQRNQAQYLTDPLATGAVIFGRPDLKLGGQISEEFIWLLGPEGVADFDRLPTGKPEPASLAFGSSGIVVMGSEEPVCQQAVIDAGHLGTGRGGHGHADALSLCLAIGQQEWLSDPGTLSYLAGTERDQFRGTSAHNTLTVDSMDQAEPSEPFAWRSQPQVQIEDWVAGQGFDLLFASHTGYRRLPHPVLHRRCVFHLKSEFWLVLDIAEGDGVHQLLISWHLRPGLIQRTVTTHGVYFAAEDQSELAILGVADCGWTQEVHNAWHSPAYGKKQACLVLGFHKQTQLPDDFATVLQPNPGASGASGHLEALAGGKSVRGYAYRNSRKNHYIFFAEQGCPWEFGAWKSDASFVYGEVSPEGILRRLFMCNGTFVETQGCRVLVARRPVARCEWFGEGARGPIFCSDEDAIDLVPLGSISCQEITQ